MTTPTTKADRVNINRAPRGGAVSPVNGLFYLGGQFMPMAAGIVEYKPVPLVGSVRQVAWANRLRREALGRLDDEINARLLFLASPKDARTVRPAIRRLMVARHALMVERSASVVIDRRAMLA
jgi:hypothetical protein